MVLSPIQEIRDASIQVDYVVPVVTDIIHARKTVRHVIRAREGVSTHDITRWLNEKKCEKFKNRSVTPVHDRTYLFFVENDAENNLPHRYFAFYEDSLAIQFKLTFGGA